MLSKQDKEDLINSIQIFEENIDEDILYNTILKFNNIVAKYISQYDLNEDMMRLLIEQQRWLVVRAESNIEVASRMEKVLNFININ